MTKPPPLRYAMHPTGDRSRLTEDDNRSRRRALDSGAPPSMARWARLPMTPEEVAASYDAQEAGADSEAAGAEAADVAEAG